MKPPAEKRGVKATATSLQLIEAIQARPGITVSQLASEVGIAKSTVKYHLTTLEQNEYLVREANRYHIGLKLFELGRSALTRNMGDTTKNKVEELAAKTNGEADFSVEEFGRIILLYDHIGSSAEPGFEEGARHLMHNNAAGKAILAEWPEEQVDELVSWRGLPGRTKNTITTRDRLSEELDQIRTQGYAINDEEYMEGHRSISVVVKRADGSIHGALTVGGPSYRVNSRILEGEFRTPLIQTKEELERELTSTAPN